MVNRSRLSPATPRPLGLPLPSYPTAYQKVRVVLTFRVSTHREPFVDTQQADYNVVATVNYRANGAVATACLNQYTDLISQYYGNLNNVLSQRCSAVNVNMNVSFMKAMPSLVEENLVKIDFVLEVLPVVRQPQLYDLCGSTLSLMFDLSVPYASAVIEPLLNVSSIGNLCPPLRALRSSNTRGFTCSVGEVLNMDTNDVPRCCK